MSADIESSGPYLCPKCNRTTLAWSVRARCYVCLAVEPLCSFSESQYDHVRRLYPHESFRASVAPAGQEEQTYRKCPSCSGTRSMQVMEGDGVMTECLCPCARTDTPGFVRAWPVAHVERTYLDRDRLLVAIWDAITHTDDVAGLMSLEALIAGRRSGVFIARRSLGLPEISLDDMVIPDRMSQLQAAADLIENTQYLVQSYMDERDKLLVELHDVMRVLRGSHILNDRFRQAETLLNNLATAGVDVELARQRLAIPPSTPSPSEAKA
jgi:hypothetical protein